ncbi:MAG: STAS domain-containing protein [Oculatellaceae cyanobacterium Prado106]|jgi:anti-anti-sigma factor|nr:STAS domain-containing protein [Oculatellaceae cyanobacterium Prado106]
MQTILSHSRIKVVQLQGNIRAESAIALQQHLADAISAPEHTAVVVDMSQVSSLDRSGLMVLVSTLTLAQRFNKQFRLVGVCPSVRIIFEISQLDRVFEITETTPAFEQAA